MGRMGRWARNATAVAGVTLGAAGAVGAQDLADFDYEDLTLRGIGFEASWIQPNRVDDTHVLGVRFDLGYLGPGLRILPRVSFWDSFLDAGEVARLEGRVESLIEGVTPPQTPPVSVDLGRIRWSDLTIGMDAQFV